MGGRYAKQGICGEIAISSPKRQKIIRLYYVTFGLGCAGMQVARWLRIGQGDRVFRELFADIAPDGNRPYVDDGNILNPPQNTPLAPALHSQTLTNDFLAIF